VKRTNQLVLESSVVGGLLMMIVLGGALSGLNVPKEWSILQNPDNVGSTHDLGALALYYNTTLTDIGSKNFENASLLIRTFDFVNIPASVNQTALVANSEVASMNASMPRAFSELGNASQLIASNEYVNATLFVAAGCLQAGYAQGNLTQFSTATTTALAKLGVPVSQYSKGTTSVEGEISSLLSTCNSLGGQLPSQSSRLVISSPQTSISTGGRVELQGNLTNAGVGIGTQSVLFYLNGSYFGSLSTDSDGSLQGLLTIPFVYEHVGIVNAIALKNATVGSGGALSNDLNFTILFNATSIVVGDPPAVLPTFSFAVGGNLTTTTGVPLPDAPVRITFLGKSSMTTTDAIGAFRCVVTVPANATDGIYYVFAAFAPRGALGPSVNFTSVQVVHLPLHIAVGLPSLSLAGFSVPVTGTLSGNGSGLAGAAITATTPWGAYKGSSGAGGIVSLRVPVPIWEFSLSGQISIRADPAQPYFSQASIQTKAGLLNPLLIVLPAIGVGATAYEFKSLGLLRRSGKGEAVSGIAALQTKAQVDSLAALERLSEQSTGMLSVYYAALALAQRRFGISFRDSDTLREIAAKVEKQRANEGGLFSSIVRATEDFLYAPGFDEGRAREAERRLADLRKDWEAVDQ
jgi:hypothetical protein